MSYRILCGDAAEQLSTLPDESVNCVVTSPPYFGLRDYGVDGQIGLEQTPEQYVQKLVEVFREVRRVLKKDGTLWLNIADSYAGSNKGINADGHISAGLKQATSKGTIQGILRKTGTPDGLKPKDLIGIPWRLAFALQADGWWLRSDIIWDKPNCMPESVTDRPTRSHEYIFLLTKSERYYYDNEAIKEPASEESTKRRKRADLRQKEGWAEAYHGNPPQGLAKKQDGVGKRTYTDFNARYQPVTMRNKRDVWRVSTKPFRGAHFATFPPDLIEPCILAGAPLGGLVLDPFAGAGTTLLVAERLGRDSIGIELNPAYCEMMEGRLASG